MEVFGPGGVPLVRGAPSRLTAESIRTRHRALLADASAAGGYRRSGSPARAAEGGPGAGARASAADVVRWAAPAGDRALREGELGFGEGTGLLDAAAAALPPAALGGGAAGAPRSYAMLGGGAPGLQQAGALEGGAAGRPRSYSAVASATAASAASTAGAAEFPAAAPVAGSAPAPADAAAAQVRSLPCQLLLAALGRRRRQHTTGG